jgi:K+ transporter
LANSIDNLLLAGTEIVQLLVEPVRPKRRGDWRASAWASRRLFPFVYSRRKIEVELWLTALNTVFHVSSVTHGLMGRNAVSASDYFQIPPKRVVELGTQVEL